MKATKEKMFWLKLVTVAILFSAQPIALGIDVLTSQARAELSAENGQTDSGESAFSPAFHAEDYDPSWNVASESSVAPGNVANVVEGTETNGGILRPVADVGSGVRLGPGGGRACTRTSRSTA